MKRVYYCFLSFLIMGSILASITSCSFISEIVDGLADFSESGEVTNDDSQMESTDAPENAVPFVHTPEIDDYRMPQEEFDDPLEKEASEIIDGAIAKALSYVEVMKDDRHSTVSFVLDEDAGGYISALTDVEREYYRIIVDHAERIEHFTITEKEYPGGSDGLRNLFFNLFVPLSYCEPGISSYFLIYVNTYGREDYTTHYSSVFDVYFDPYRDGNATVEGGAVTIEEVKHGAELLDRVVKRVVRFMPEGLTTYDKYYYLAAVLCEKVSYDKRPDNCFSAFGALIDGRAVCEGYACAYYMLCREANLWCAYRNGLPEGQGHIWNMIKLDSGIYNVDVTWCDGYGKPFERDWYDCFVKSDQVFSDDGHSATSGVQATGIFEASPYEKIE